ncbi:MAG: TonB-dependent receptor [Woeseiaceae bacterium]|nr:TonB-dependent receptor [Woeseiaceae bacterium]
MIRVTCPPRARPECAADGITQPFQSFIVNASQEATLSGNPELDSEIAESLTYGVVLRPRFLENFTMSVDWFDIEITNAIETGGNRYPEYLLRQLGVSGRIVLRVVYAGCRCGR